MRTGLLVEAISDNNDESLIACRPGDGQWQNKAIKCGYQRRQGRREIKKCNYLLLVTVVILFLVQNIKYM